MALADSCQIYLQSGMLPEKVVDCCVFSRIFAEGSTCFPTILMSKLE